MNKLHENLGLKNYKDITWKTQDSNLETILFYKFNKKDEHEVRLFQERIKDCNFANCVINLELDSNRFVCVTDKEFQQLQEEILNKLYPLNKDLKFLGVTGTNGKTTSVDLIRQLSIKKKKNILTVGTLGLYFNDNKVEDFSLTTPAYIDLRKAIYKYQDELDVVAMELSSHSLVQNRTGEIKFSSIGWTCFTQDHLDFHGSMEEYFNAKSLVFNHLIEGKFLAVPETQRDLINKLKAKKIRKVKVDSHYHNPFFKMIYNQENLAIALALLDEIGIKNFSQEEVESLNAPPGRFNIIDLKEKKVIIDYAHTPDSLKSITEAIRNSFPKESLLTVFGCGGDRDRSKRPLMANASELNSNFVILTSDNPRFEDPVQIMNDAKKGFKKTNHKLVINRKEAIREALSSNFDIILIAGKGHENYIDENGVKRAYSDLATVQEVYK